MRVSVNEIERVCAKVFEGLGFAPGLDTDAAFMAAWAERHGLDGLRAVDAVATRTPRPHPALQPVDDGPGRVVFDAAGRSMLAAAPVAIDFGLALALRAAGAGPIRVTVRDCAAPALALGLCARRADPALGYRIAWTDESGDPASGTVYEGAVALYGAAARQPPSHAPAEVTLTFTAGVSPPTDTALEPDPPAVTATELEARSARAFAHGVEVDDAIWRQLGQRAKRVLVPNSELSQRRGAGAEVDDSG